MEMAAVFAGDDKYITSNDQVTSWLFNRGLPGHLIQRLCDDACQSL